ncbi:RIO1 family regulatory kinase/ATPase domain-containing protein [Methanofollis fontis]|uniref:non-specific serine/threonine protein kinase n=1 Tax=Methanofollis fontis TaxID=2052832 RepID=A0A483CRR2_9EURY|nr:RIO1 family regulatory kinase/ATPase [Methanofollis fontis]TAJ45823.1 serine/threonine protein phosphatase [Methanofollis fontis]
MPLSPEYVRRLHKYDLRVLLALERLMQRYEWVPDDVLRAAARLSEKELAFRLARLIEWDMVRHATVPYAGYALIFPGYDAIALHTLSQRGSVSALGSLIGVGKESEVFSGLGLGPVVLKFHHVGQQSFQAARKERGYMPEGAHCPWIFASARSAEQEYAALQRLSPDVAVPLPIDRSRHVIVMSEIPGATLNRCTLEAPEEVLDEVLENVRIAYRKGVIHGDLSEFNIMAGDDGVWLIDWPQWIATDHPNAEALLRRDLENVLRYFNRKYRIEYPTEEAVGVVIG